MKAILSIIAFLLLSNIILAQTTAIPDSLFEQELIDLGYDTGTPDGSVPTANIDTVTSLDVHSSSITDLTGIEDLISLTCLDVGFNNLTSIDVASNTALTDLNCRSNSLTSLNISSNTALTHLNCRFNSLTSIDVSNNTALTYLSCGANSLTSIDVSNNTVLTDLSCGASSLTSIDVSRNAALTVLNCRSNSLSSLDVSSNTALTELGCGFNSLTSLDVSNNTALTYLSCSGNDLTTLDVSNNTALTDLYCHSNSLTSLDLRNGNNITFIYLNAAYNPNLYCITVDDSWHSTVNWHNPTANWGISEFKIDDWTQYTNFICGNNTISGYAYHDEDLNCTQDAGDQGLFKTIIKADGPVDMYATTNDNGYYRLMVDPNINYNISVIPSGYSNLFEGYCPDTGYTINSGHYGAEITNIDFGIQLKDCALLSVDVSKSRMRRCFRSNTTISYKNEGPTYQVNAEIFVDFPEYIKLISASESYIEIDATEGIYKFSIDTMQAFSEGKITIIDSVICGNENIRGYTQCIKAWIIPKSYCDETKDTTLWDKSSIKVLDKAQCIGDSIARFTIINAGDGDMLTAHEYRLYYNNQLAYTASFQLVSGDSLGIDVTADGSTIRLEADQHPLHPGNSKPRTTIEGCGAFVPLDASLGFWTKAANDDLDVDIAEKCLVIVASYDPNDKKVSPEGITDNHYVPENELLDYTIRFQNTGSDTAFKVIVVDTLSDQLNLESLTINGASHEYKYDVAGENVKVLAFTFNDLNLPDSTTDESGSHGFVSFSISPINSIIPGTRIENYADIYFDYNSEIRTDTAFVTALDTVISSDKTITVTEIGLSASISENESPNISIYPNPSNNYLIINGVNDKFNLLKLYDVTSRLLISKTITANQQRVDVQSLPKGVYFIHLASDTGEKYTYKIVKQ